MGFPSSDERAAAWWRASTDRRRRHSPPTAWVSKLTESRVTGDIEHSVRVLNALRDRGFRIAMDDFGTGYSALTFLRRLPFAEVKIDRAFVQDITEDPEDRDLIRAIIGTAHNLGMAALPEGVETHAQADCLSPESRDCAQGFLFTRPMPAEQLAEWLGAAHAVSPPDANRKG